MKIKLVGIVVILAALVLGLGVQRASAADSFPPDAPVYELPLENAPLPFGEGEYTFPTVVDFSSGVSIQILRNIPYPSVVPAWRFYLYSPSEGNVTNRPSMSYYSELEAPGKERLAVLYVRVVGGEDGNHVDPFFIPYAENGNQPIPRAEVQGELQGATCAPPDYAVGRKPYSIPERYQTIKGIPSLPSDNPNINPLAWTPPKPWYLSNSLTLQPGEIREGWMLCRMTPNYQGEYRPYWATSEDTTQLWPPSVNRVLGAGEWGTLPDIEVKVSDSSYSSFLQTPPNEYTGPVEFAALRGFRYYGPTEWEYYPPKSTYHPELGSYARIFVAYRFPGSEDFRHTKREGRELTIGKFYSSNYSESITYSIYLSDPETAPLEDILQSSTATPGSFGQDNNAVGGFWVFFPLPRQVPEVWVKISDTDIQDTNKTSLTWKVDIQTDLSKPVAWWDEEVVCQNGCIQPNAMVEEQSTLQGKTYKPIGPTRKLPIFCPGEFADGFSVGESFLVNQTIMVGTENGLVETRRICGQQSCNFKTFFTEVFSMGDPRFYKSRMQGDKIITLSYESSSEAIHDPKGTPMILDSPSFPESIFAPLRYSSDVPFITQYSVVYPEDVKYSIVNDINADLHNAFAIRINAAAWRLSCK